MSVLNWSGILSAPLARPALEEPAEERVLDVRDLRMRYGRTDVLNGVTFTARRGEVLALLGPNGAGKTTTIEILEGFRMRSAGQVSVLGVDPARGGEAWRARIGVVLQSWRDHAKWQVRELLTHLGSYYAPYAVPGRILILAGGRIIADGSADEPTRFVRDLFRQYGESIEDLEVRRARYRAAEVLGGDRMSASWVAVRAGVRRGWIELKHSFTTPGDLVPLVIWTAALLGVMVWTRTTTVPGTHFSLGTAMMAGAIGMNVGFNGLATLGGVLAVEREDGTLLRAKAVPHGMAGYLIGKVVTVAATILISVAITLITGPFLFSGLALGSAGTWLTLIPVLLLGLAATLPIGAILGSLIPSARSAGLLTLASGGLIAVSGIFYPITHLPQWLQWTGQVFPFYWLGLGMRSALLPAGLASVEIGHSWRHLATFGVLGAWAVIGLLAAPVVLRRMARREAGSSVAARREKAMLRVG